MIKTIKKMKSKTSKLSLMLAAWMGTLGVSMATPGTDPLAKAKPEIAAALGTGSTVYFVVLGVGFVTCLVKGKRSGDMMTWMGLWATAFICWSIFGLLVPSS